MPAARVAEYLLNTLFRFAPLTPGTVFCAVVIATVSVTGANAQATRAAQIEQQRREKVAKLWPERESPMVEMVNGLVDRGWLEGATSGQGANGWQAVLGGMRSGHGFTAGIGYRRTDLMRDALGWRTTVRGTPQLAYMIDSRLDFQQLRSDRSELYFDMKYENSPMMDFYGQGPDSSKSFRSSYRLEDVNLDLKGRFRVLGKFYLRGLVGGMFVNTGRGKRKGFPSTDELFPPEELPGIQDQTDFFKAGGGIQFDWRDNPRGPKYGGNYYADLLHYSDTKLSKHSFTRLDMAVEQYVPYFNRSRVIALRVAAAMTFAQDGQSVPFYLLPTLGGNEMLRGFARYRFHDENYVIGVVEHRWHVFAGMDAAIFMEAGKVVPKIRFLNLSKLEYAGGIGLRFKIKESVFMRIDGAVSREGLRVMWTFNNVF